MEKTFEIQQLIIRIAARLFNEGLTYNSYEKDKAYAILDRCVAPVACRKVLDHFEKEVLGELATYDEGDAFIAKVKSMSIKEIILTMVDALRNPVMRVNMATFGSVDWDRDKDEHFCVGCAATNTISKIAGITFTPQTVQGSHYRAEAIGVRSWFLGGFECALDSLRSGMGMSYNELAERYGFAQIPVEKLNNVHLPIIYSDCEEEVLKQYEDFANSLEQ